MSDRTVSVIGAGRMGKTIARALARAGYEIGYVFNRDARRAEESVRFIGKGNPVSTLSDIQSLSGTVLITTVDTAIEPVCGELVAAKRFRPPAVVLHMSGSMASSVLASAGACGAHVGSLHPLQSVCTPTDDPAIFRGVTFAYEGDDAAKRTMLDIIRAVEGLPVEIEAAQKALYHAAAVMACNYLVTLLDAALDIYAAVGIERDDAMNAIVPIVETTLANVRRMGTGKALTGPIARGDSDTVARNMHAVAAYASHLKDVFAALGRVTVSLARRERRITTEQAEKLLQALS